MPAKGDLVSRAWLRHGIRGMFGTAEPGLLIGRGDHVLFVTKKGVVFDAARGALKANWPWWEFGAGVHITIGGEINRISLVRPPEAEEVNLDAAGELATHATIDPTGINSIGEGLQSGTEWKAFLATRS